LFGTRKARAGTWNDRADFTMTFQTDGFFSKEIDHFRQTVRTTTPFREWFDYALGLNRIGLDLLRTATTPRSDSALLTMHTLFVRAHQSFQAALVLLERGMIGDSRMVLRSGVEGAIAIRALANDPSFVDQLVEAHYLNQRKLARVVLTKPDYAVTYAPQQIAEMQAAIAEVDTLEKTKGRPLKEVNWADVALKYCPELYDLLYRSLSSDGTHATINSLNRFVQADANMEIIAVKVAPDTEGLVEALSAASLLFLWAVDPFAAAIARPDVTAQIRDQVQRFAELPEAFPGKTPAAV
jgi:hypothetical protein